MKQILEVEVECDVLLERKAEYRIAVEGEELLNSKGRVIRADIDTCAHWLVVRTRKIWKRPAILNKRWKWLVMDEDKRWYCHDQEPKQGKNTWHSNGSGLYWHILYLNPYNFDLDGFNLPKVNNWTEAKFKIVD